MAYKPKKIDLPYTILTFDIETKLKEFLSFSCGETVLRHTQLTERSALQHNIICIAAKWYHKKEVMLFTGPNAVEEFDKEARKADVCLGKNNHRFDNKYINTERMMRGLKPYPEWMDTSEDLERQLRRNFNFTSQSLDYISKLFGFGGKEKMEFSDWRDIHNYELLTDIDKASTICSVDLNATSKVLFNASVRQVTVKGKAALKKMYHYNKKDVLDTENVLIKVLPYIKLKKNASTHGGGKDCTVCGSKLIVATKIITLGTTKYQQFDCLEHNGYAGKATVRYDKNRNKVYGRMS